MAERKVYDLLVPFVFVLGTVILHERCWLQAESTSQLAALHISAARFDVDNDCTRWNATRPAVKVTENRWSLWRLAAGRNIRCGYGCVSPDAQQFHYIFARRAK